MHPYLHVHFQLATWTMPLFEPCRARALVVTATPRDVTCPICRQGLQDLACVIQHAQMLPKDALSA